MKNNFRYIASVVGLVVVSCSATSAFAYTDPAKTYTEEQLTSANVAGLHLFMTDDEAAKVLKEGGFQGKFPAFKGDERMVTPWVKSGQKIAVFRFKDKDGIIRVHSIEFNQNFDRPVDVDTVKSKLSERYGEPTQTHPDLIWREAYTFDHAKVQTCIDGPSEYRAACLKNIGADNTVGKKVEDEENGAMIKASVWPKQLRIIVSDDKVFTNAEAMNLAAKAAADKAKAQKDTKDTSLGF